MFGHNVCKKKLNLIIFYDNGSIGFICMIKKKSDFKSKGCWLSFIVPFTDAPSTSTSFACYTILWIPAVNCCEIINFILKRMKWLLIQTLFCEILWIVVFMVKWLGFLNQVRVSPALLFQFWEQQYVTIITRWF